jgi:hypothetical protein
METRGAVAFSQDSLIGGLEQAVGHLVAVEGGRKILQWKLSWIILG